MKYVFIESIKSFFLFSEWYSEQSVKDSSEELKMLKHYAIKNSLVYL